MLPEFWSLIIQKIKQIGKLSLFVEFYKKKKYSTI